MELTPTQAGNPAVLPNSAQPPEPESGRTAIASDFDTFLKMLTAQIQNQDPLKPTPSDEFAVQLATFSSVEQQVRTNELLEALGTQFGGAGLGQYASWVGMEGRAAAPVRFDGQPITLSPAPAAGADRAELVVRDANGREIERFDIAASSDPVQWTGHSATGAPHLHGSYSFELVSFSEGMPIESSTVEAYGRIVEAREENGQTILVLASGAQVPASEVSALRQPTP